MGVTSGQPPLGQLLLEMGFIDQAQLTAALDEQTRSGKRLGKILIDSGVISEDRLVHALSRQLGIEACDPIMTPVHQRVLSIIPSDIAFRHRVLPVARQREPETGEVLYVATSDPLDKRALQAIRTVVPPTTRVRWMLAGETELELALARHYRVVPATAEPAQRTTNAGIPVLQGRPVGPPPPGRVGMVAKSDRSGGTGNLVARDNEAEIMDQLEQAVLRSGDLGAAPRVPDPPPPMPHLTASGDLALPDSGNGWLTSEPPDDAPGVWTGGDLAGPDMDAEGFVGDALRGELSAPEPYADIMPPENGHEPERLPSTDLEEILVAEEVVDGSGEFAVPPELREAESLPPAAAKIPPALVAPEAPLAAVPPPASASEGVAHVAKKPIPAPVVKPPPSSSGPNWGDLLDDPNPASVTASLRPMSPQEASDDDPEIVSPPPLPKAREIEAIEIPELSGDEAPLEIVEIGGMLEPPPAVPAAPAAAAPMDDIPISDSVDIAEPDGLLVSTMREAVTADPVAPSPVPRQPLYDGPTEPDLDIADDGPSMLIDDMAVGSTAQSGEHLHAPPSLDLLESNPAIETAPMADFLQMAAAAGVSPGLEITQVPAAAPSEEAIELGASAEELPDVSEDVLAEDAPVLLMKEGTGDLIALPKRATEVRDRLMRVLSGADESAESTRWALRLVISVLVEEGVFSDDRILRAAEKLKR